MKTKLLRTFVALLLTTLATVTAWAADNPPTVSNKTVTATKVDCTNITINWNKATDDFTPQKELLYIVRYKAVGESDYHETAKLKNTNSYTVTGLKHNTEYQIQVVVRDGSNRETFYEVLTIRTPEDKEPPTVANKDIRVTDRGHHSIRIDLDRCEDNATPKDKIQYYLSIKKQSESTYKIVDHGNLGFKPWYEFQYTDLEPSTTYNIIVEAYDENNNKLTYNVLTASTIIETDPPVISDKHIWFSNITGNSMCVSWHAANDDITPQSELGYSIEYSRHEDGLGGGWLFTKGMTMYVVNQLKPNTWYDFSVQVGDPSGGTAYYEPATAKTMPMYYENDKEAPTLSNKKLTVTNATDNSLTLNWTKAKDNLFDDEDLSYTVAYKLPSDARYSRDGVEQGNNISSSRITSLKPNTTYEFIVRVKDRVGNTSTYDILTYTTSNAQDRTAPTIANKTVTAADVTYGSVALTWNKATDNVTKQENLQYSVYRDGVLCKKMKGETSYIVGDLNPSTKYTFEVRVEDEAGNISKYNTVQATTKAKPTTVTAYPLYIEGTLVTSANAKDFWGDGGTISYEPTTKTLKLNWAELNSLVINDNITINLVGWTTIYGLVDVRGSSNVTIKADDKYGENAQLKILGQLYCTCDLAIKNECTVEIDATGKINNPGLILNDHRLSVYGSTLKVKGDSKNVTVSGIGELYMQDSRITSEHKYDSTNHKFLNADGSIAKDDIVISTEIIRVPVLANDEIEVEEVTEDGALLSWVEATDDETPQSDLVYTLYTMRRYGDTFYFYYKDGRNLTSCKLYNLKSDTEYYAMVRVEDKDGHMTFYKETLFKTLPESDKTAPTLANGTVNVTDVTYSSANISWAKASDNKTAQSKLYYIAGYKKSSEPESGLSLNVYNAIANGHDMTSCTVENLEPATSYDFYVVVYDEASNGAAYTKATFVTEELPDVTAPALGEVMISVDEVTEKSITMSWSPATDDRTPQDKLVYSVEYRKAGESAWITRNAGNSTAYSINGLAVNTDYEVSIKVADEAGNETSYGEFTITTVNPSAITAITADGSDGKMYSPSGVRVSGNFRGIVIKDGKKVMVKE